VTAADIVKVAVLISSLTLSGRMLCSESSAFMSYINKSLTGTKGGKKAE
jgi:hypothetical protein